jgi:manganese oxidase
VTDSLIRTLARRPSGSLARPSVVAIYAALLSVVGAAWLWFTARADGAVADAQVLPWEVAALAGIVGLPVMVVAVWLAALLTRHVVRGEDAADRTLLAAAVFAAAAAVSGAVASALGWLVAASLRDVQGAAFDLLPLLSAAQLVLFAMPALLVVSGALTALMASRRPWAVPDVQAWRSPATRLGRLAMGGALAGVVALPALVIGGPMTPQASAGNTVCEAGAPEKLFVVRAIDVNIPLNRFGDQDPLGRMYVLEGYWDASTGLPRPSDASPFNTNPAANDLATGNLQLVRAQELSRHVSPGLGDDPIQPLVIRANLGDCVTIRYTNATAADTAGISIDGLAHQIDSSGDTIGKNTSSAVSPGGSRIFTYNVPKNEPGLEGTRYIRPGPGNRDAVSHGLFGALVVEPEGSRYLSNYEEGVEIISGWEAIIDVPAGKEDFREHVQLFHEIGDEKFQIENGPVGATQAVPMKDPTTTAYRPGARAISYRSEPFMNRLLAETRAKSLAYNSYTFGDPSTTILKGYVGDPTKIRILHAGGEMLHVYHLHGGGIRWRMNPQADATYDYGDTGLRKKPVAELSSSQRLDSQSFGPGESYELEIESGAGGTQQAAGELLFHCHIAEHYLSGMWGLWRIHDTKQAGVATLPDRAALPAAVDSTGLIGKTMPDGTTLTADNIDEWIRPQLPSQGVPTGTWEDNSSWDWQIASGANGPVYLGAPTATAPVAGDWANLMDPADLSSPWDAINVPGSASGSKGPVSALSNGLGSIYPGLLPGDTADDFSGQVRPRILFNPTNGRPSHPLLRPEILKRAPFSGNGHSGAPYLGEKADQPRDPAIPGPQPWAARKDGMCPSDAPIKRFNLVSVEIDQQVTKAGALDKGGKIYTLAKNKAAVAAGEKREPLFIRMNTGDCGFITLTSEQVDDPLEQPYSMTSAHIHHVQFDPQASDGVGAGYSYGQAVRPYKIEDRQMTQASAVGATQITMQSVKAAIRPGVWIGVGLGTDDIEIVEVASVSGNVINLKKPLQKAHSADEWAGTEFLQSVWYPDVALDNIFWHDHVDGIHNWGHGLVSQLIIEPRGSTYHDPVTGAEVDSGAVVDIHTSNPLVPGAVEGSFREFAMLTIDGNGSGVDSTINLRSEPVLNRTGPGGNPDQSLVFSSYTHGDPYTMLPRAYKGDPVVIRTINVSPGVDTFEIDGHRFALDPRLQKADGTQAGSPTSAMVYGISERFTLVLQGGAGGILNEAGDYLYRNGQGRRFKQGAWGLIRVLDRQVADLKPLPGTNVPTGDVVPPPVTGGRPPEPSSPGDSCPTDAPVRTFAIAAVDLDPAKQQPPNPLAAVTPLTSFFVPVAQASAVIDGLVEPEPLVLHAAEGDCVEVTLTNKRQARTSFHVSEVVRSVKSSGVNAGFTPEQTVATGKSRTYRIYADDARVGATPISDFGGVDTGPSGLYGALVVAPKGAVFRDPVTGDAKDIGTQVDVSAPGEAPYRAMTAIVADDDDIIGGDFTPYAPISEGPNYLNYKNEGLRGDGPLTFSSATIGDPGVVFRALPGDRVKVHVVGAPGSEQMHMFSVGGHAWHRDAAVKQSEVVTVDRVGSGTSLEADLIGGAGGPARASGDYFIGDLRRPFTQAGVWGIFRVLPDPTPSNPADIKPLPTPFPPSLSTPYTPDSAPASGSQQGLEPLKAVAPKTVQPLSGLVAPSRLSLQALYKKGMSLKLKGPSDITSLTVRIEPVKGTKGVRGQATIKRLAAAVSGRTALTRSADGTYSLLWRVPPRVVSRLKAGTYTVTVIGPANQLASKVKLFDAAKPKAKTKKKATKASG